jgi:DNA repair protein RadA/Sms
MSKVKTVYTCQNCGAQSPKWIGRCPSCGEWNTYVEEIVSRPKRTVVAATGVNSRPLKLEEIHAARQPRIKTPMEEINRVLGGGIVPGSVILIGGEPGIGKSTLILQLALGLKNKKVLYASGEESLQQLKLRAERLKLSSPECLFISETSLENLLAHLEHQKPDILIIDSIQTLSTEAIESSPGSVAQVRECTTAVLHKTKKSPMAVFLIGHINKEGNLAGPKVLEHIVDTVIQFEGDSTHMFRILRSVKNRFGSTSELGIFEMRDTGLTEVKNPSEQLITHTGDSISGTAIAATLEGIRPILVEIQALVSSAAYGTPQRSSTGFDLRRLNMLLAVLEKRAGFKLAARDVFLNVAGGLRVSDPATDLAVICSVLSSSLDLPVGPKTCFAGEVGLTGEVRPVHQIEKRITEAAKLGFKRIMISGLNKEYIHTKNEIEIVRVNRVSEAFRILFRPEK